jgi:site-specific recombinase XerD
MDSKNLHPLMTISADDKVIQVPDKQREYLHHATAVNTRRAYQAAIRQFEAAGGLLPATEQAIAQYLTGQASRLNPRTLSLHLTALSHWHRYQRLPDPTQTAQIRKLLIGIFRQHGQPKRKAKALYPEHIEKMIAHCCKKAPHLRSCRDSALIQVAYFGAFRRSELVAMRFEHLHFDSKGLLILIPRSKTDQMGEGKVKALPYGHGQICPVTAMKRWLEVAKINGGVIFRSINRWDKLQAERLHPDSISSIVKSLARSCQFDFVDQLSSHSLRRGFATSAASAGADFEDIKRQGGWGNDNTVREYIEEGQLFDKNAADQLMKSSFNKS